MSNDNVIELRPGSKNRACPKCGSQWWTVRAVVIVDNDDSIGGYAGPVECYECSGGDLMPLVGGAS